jgi:hypothetical protein
VEGRTDVDGQRTHPEPVESAAYHGSVDDEFRSVLEGLRTTLPGTQALFGFLLILPFQPGFEGVGSAARIAYYVAFFSAAVATILLVAPSAHQRFRAPRSGIQRRSDKHLHITVWVTIAGTVVLAVSLGASVFLITEVMLSNFAAATSTAAVTFLMAMTWIYLPLVTFERIE